MGMGLAHLRCQPDSHLQDNLRSFSSAKRVTCLHAGIGGSQDCRRQVFTLVYVWLDSPCVHVPETEETFSRAKAEKEDHILRHEPKLRVT